MAILEHILPDAGEHLTRWRETLIRESNAIRCQLDAIREAVQDQQTTPTRLSRHLSDEGNSGTGNDVALRMAPPSGFDWDLTLVSTVGGTGGGMGLYLGSLNPANLLFVVGNSEFASEILPDIPVPAGSVLIAHFYDQPVNTVCAVHLVLKSVNAEMGAGS